jgi:glutamine synthetase
MHGPTCIFRANLTPSSLQAVASAALKKHDRVIFNGDNYDEGNQQMLTDNGVHRCDSGVDAIDCLSSTKNVALFEKLGVMTGDECAARRSILFDHYVGTVEIESKCMVDMLNQHVIPAVKEAGIGPLAELNAAVATLNGAIAEMHALEDKPQADAARVLRLETMVALRETVDAAEAVVPANLWTLPTYRDLLFLDQSPSSEWDGADY